MEGHQVGHIAHGFLGLPIITDFRKRYVDKVYLIQKVMRNKGKKFEWNEEAQAAFENMKREMCEAPVLDMPTEKDIYDLDTYASVVANSGILHQE